MASPLDEMTKLLANLSIGGNCKQILESLRTIAASVPPTELRDYVPKIDIDRLFMCLSTIDREQVDLTCDLLSYILNSHQPSQALRKYQNLFLEGLSHPQNLVKEITLQQLQRIADEPVAANQMSHNLELILACLHLVGAEDLGVAMKAVKVLTTLSKHPTSVNIFIQPQVIEKMQQISHKNDTIRYRVYEIIVAVAAVSEEKLSFIHDSKLLHSLLEEASKNDILVQLNALELLRTLATYEHGRNYLEREKIILKLQDQLSSLLEDPLASLIIPGIMKFFGTLAHFQADILTKYPKFTDVLFSCLNNYDMTLVIVSIETLAFIATQTRGKIALHQQGSLMDNAMSKFGELLNHANADVRVKALHSLAELFLVQSPKDELGTEEAMAIMEHWFSKLSSSPISLLINIMKQPFKELRLEVLNVFLHLSSQPWAQKLMSQQPGFVEFLVDRKAEPDKSCLERKFNVVERLVESPTSGEIFSHYAMAQMRDHVREGPWFVHAQASVAFESGS